MNEKGIPKMPLVRAILVGVILVAGLAFPAKVWTRLGGVQRDTVMQFGAPPSQPAATPNVLMPEEVTIGKGETVTFVVNGGGHGIGIYPVSADTRRADIEEDLCQGGPAVCNPATGTANRRYLVTDHTGALIVDTGVNPPGDRLKYPPEGQVAAGAGALLVSATEHGTTSTGFQYRFENPGRFLVICMNRGHSINDRMFGFVNVLGPAF
jgi:plastocyanin